MMMSGIISQSVFGLHNAYAGVRQNWYTMTEIEEASPVKTFAGRATVAAPRMMNVMAEATGCLVSAAMSHNGSDPAYCNEALRGIHGVKLLPVM
jgi:hypothetical protein